MMQAIAEGFALLQGRPELSIDPAAVGIGVLLVLWLVPSGLAGLAARVRDRLLVPIARRHGMDLEGQPLPVPTGPAADPSPRAAATADVPADAHSVVVYVPGDAALPS